MTPPRGPGRPPATTREAVERAAVALFLDRGFEHTTIHDIATACGISKTSFFRYYGSKAEILWAPFEAHLDRLHRALHGRPRGEPVLTSVLRAVLDTFTADIDTEGVWIRRFRLQEAEEQRAAQDMHWQRWAGVVADFIRGRTGLDDEDVTPEALAAAVQASFHGYLHSHEPELDVDPAAVLAGYETSVQGLMQHLQAWLDRAAP